MAMHQVGSFLGAWLGGVEFQLTGGYRWIWLADVLLAAAAALAHVPVREGATTPSRPASFAAAA
jgi:predicted MFS family arabinose efflux permease